MITDAENKIRREEEDERPHQWRRMAKRQDLESSTEDAAAAAAAAEWWSGWWPPLLLLLLSEMARERAFSYCYCHRPRLPPTLTLTLTRLIYDSIQWTDLWRRLYTMNPLISLEKQQHHRHLSLLTVCYCCYYFRVIYCIMRFDTTLLGPAWKTNGSVFHSAPFPLLCGHSLFRLVSKLNYV